MDLKAEVSRIMREALSGRNQKYRTEDDYIKWGLVEKDIHKAIDTAFKPDIMEITRKPHHWIRITKKATALRSGSIESQSVEANLLFEILEKLEGNQCGISKVEDRLKPEPIHTRATYEK